MAGKPQGSPLLKKKIKPMTTKPASAEPISQSLEDDLFLAFFAFAFSLPLLSTLPLLESR